MGSNRAFRVLSPYHFRSAEAHRAVCVLETGFLLGTIAPLTNLAARNGMEAATFTVRRATAGGVALTIGPNRLVTRASPSAPPLCTAWSEGLRL
jgi:hypothetical protein